MKTNDTSKFRIPKCGGRGGIKSGMVLDESMAAAAKITDMYVWEEVGRFSQEEFNAIKERLDVLESKGDVNSEQFQTVHPIKAPG